MVDLIQEIDINKIDNLIDSINIIDIRDESEIALSGTLSGATHVPMSKILMTPEEYLEDGKKYYILCHSGVRSLNVCMTLSNEDFDVVNIKGGFARYRGENRVDLY